MMMFTGVAIVSVFVHDLLMEQEINSGSSWTWKIIMDLVPVSIILVGSLKKKHSSPSSSILIPLPTH